MVDDDDDDDDDFGGVGSWKGVGMLGVCVCEFLGRTKHRK